MGERLTTQIMYNSMTELVRLNEFQTMSQILIKNSKFTGKMLSEIDFTNKYGIIVAAITRDNNVIIPSATEMLHKGDKVIVIGERKTIVKLAKEM